ncbi:zinc dependent phospholipase C family protein [Pseudodesulfovibrio alkaliphilus]|nr:zinc dependent phospholipase C family protein [Pseudodesulfovibrio alkaliphilus]
MPKDLIHFDTAKRTARGLADTRFAPCLAAEGHGLLLGSVFHDALFYAAWPGDAPLERLAHALHGAQGEDTYALVRMLTTHARRNGSSLAVSILVGVVSHLFADAVMHPLVWHLTGDYYATDAKARSLARQRHRALESLMDMVACPHMLGRSRYSLRFMLHRCPALLENGLPVADLAAMAGMDSDAARAGLARAWRIFALFQAAYWSRPLALAAFALRPHLPPTAAELAALAYAPQLLRQARPLSGSISFRHPVTGERHSATLDQLTDEAAQRAAALCRKLEPAVFGPKPLEPNRIAPGETGPSMDAGLPGVESGRMRHFADPPFPELA